MFEWIRAGFGFHLGRELAALSFGLAFAAVLFIIFFLVLGVAWLHDKYVWWRRSRRRNIA